MIKKSGFIRVKIDGEIRELNSPEEIRLDKNYKHNIEIIVDRLKIGSDIRKRLTEDIEIALKESEGIANIEIVDYGEVHSFSENFSCIDCGISFEELTPRMFSFNSPYGACKECSGLGFKKEIDPYLIIEFPSKSINEGAIPFINMGYSNYYSQLMKSLSEHYDFSLDIPFEDMDQGVKDIILY